MKVPFKQIFDRIYPTLNEQEECVKFIHECVERWYIWFKDNRPKTRGRKILKFFMMPKTELHKQFKQIIVDEEKSDKQKKAWYLIKQDMDANIKKLYDQYPDDWFNYEQVNKFSTIDDDLVRITIPVSKWWKITRYWTMIISKKQTPNLYLMFM
jgi:hypothetical protein